MHLYIKNIFIKTNYKHLDTYIYYNCNPRFEIGNL